MRLGTRSGLKDRAAGAAMANVSNSDGSEPTFIDVIVAPRSSKNEVGGLVGDRIRVKVTAPAEGGKANSAVIRLIAEWANVPKSSVSIVSGHKCRRKTLKIDKEIR